MLQLIIEDCSNLLPKELVLSCPKMEQSMLFVLISFRKDCQSFSSVAFEFLSIHNDL